MASTLSLTSPLDHVLEISDLLRCFAIDYLHLPAMLDPLSTNENHSKSKVHILLYDLFKGVDTMLSARRYPRLRCHNVLHRDPKV